jgi:outer membrane receptor protein involved in Fe transport
MKKNTLLLAFFVTICSSWAQNTVSGKVTNQDLEELIGVNISAKNIPGLGAVSDFDGNYSIEIPQGCHDLLFQYIGFEDFTKKICTEQTGTITTNITLKESSEILGTVVISAGKFEQRIEEVTVSMDVIKPELIENKSANSLDKIINQAPSVHVVDGQANIRSGSGWSYGAGSRVMVMVDGMPLMSGDQGAAEWQLIPMENISQIEVIKGASSVLFGSSALNGTINIRTAYPTSEPVNKLSITHTAYGKPRRESLHWYKDGYTSANNISYLHSHKKDNKDYVLGANLFYDGGYQQKVTSKRARINMAFTNYSKQVEGLSYGVKTNIMRSEIGDAIMWHHDTLAYIALDNDPGYKDNLYISIDPFVSYNNPETGVKHTLNSRYFRVNIFPDYRDSAQYNNSEAQRYADVYFADYQQQRQLKEFITLTSGYTFRYSEGQDREIYGQHFSINHSLYSQLDLKHKKLNLSVGGRLEHFSADEESLTKPIFRSGVNYHIAKATFLRASFGQGLRFPSMLEKFVTYKTGPMYIYPNEDLKPESGWSAELGIKQGLKIGDWKGFIDLAAFIMEYNDMMEFSFGAWGPPENFLGLGFKSINIGTTRIKGLELSLAGEGVIHGFDIMILGSYTYTIPEIDDKYHVYGYDNNDAPLNYNTTSSDRSGILKYRYEHLAKMDINISKNRIQFGTSVRFNSEMKNIDAIFESELLELLQPLGIKDSRERYDGNTLLADVRVGYDITENSSLAANIDNVFNTEYLMRPASLGAPRTYSLLYRIKF